MSPRDGEDSVSSVVGTILMLAVTVTVFGGLSIVVLDEIRSTDTPPQAELAFVADGDRAILAHRGGEPIPLEGGSLLLNVNGAEVRYDLTAVADQTADGRFWRIGETLCLSGPDPPDPARPCLVADQPILGVAVVSAGGLLADEGERGGDAGPCPLDNVAPTAATPWTFSVDVRSTTTGPVTVSFSVTDDCSGPDDAVEPAVFFRIQDGSSPAFTAIAASSVTNTGPGAWDAVVPSQSWNLQGGKTLQLYASGLADVNGNVAGATAIESEPIQAVQLITYVSTSTTVTGTVGPLGPAQSDGDSDAATTVTEGATTTPAGTVGPTKLSGPTAGTSGGTSQTNVLSSNNQYGTMGTDGSYLEVSGFVLPSSANAVTAVVIGFEGYRDSGGSNPTIRLDYKLGAAGTVSNGPTFGLPATTEANYTRSLCTTQVECTALGLTVSGFQTMYSRVTLVTDQSKNPQVDHVYATVTYTTSAQTTYSLDVGLEFSPTQDGSTETLELRYQTSGDTFALDVWDTTINAGAGGYTQVGTLSSPGTFTDLSHVLASGEFNAGAPRIRLRDLTPTGTVQGTLLIEYARVVTV